MIRRVSVFDLPVRFARICRSECGREGWWLVVTWEAGAPTWSTVGSVWALEFIEHLWRIGKPPVVR